MFIRWLHKIWVIFWRVFLILLVTVVILGGGVFGVLQLDQTQQYISDRIEKEFNASYKGTLTIGELDGLLPFRLTLNQVLFSTDTVTTGRSGGKPEPLRFESLSVTLDLTDLLRRDLTITGFDMNNPSVKLYLGENGKYTLAEVFKRRNTPSRRSKRYSFDGIEIMAPYINISGGEFYVDKFKEERNLLDIPEPFRITNVQSSMYMELRRDQRYIDIENFEADMAGNDPSSLTVSGQLFNNNQLIELNGFFLQLGRSSLNINGEIKNIDVFDDQLKQQFKKARYNVTIDSTEIFSKELAGIMPVLPEISLPYRMSTSIRGSLDSLDIEYLALGVGQSYVNFNGYVTHPLRTEKLTYYLNLSETDINSEDIKLLQRELPGLRKYKGWDSLSVMGYVNGSIDSVNADLTAREGDSKLMTNFTSSLSSPVEYRGRMSGRNIHPDSIMATALDSTNLNFELALNGVGFTLNKSVFNANVNLEDSKIHGVPITGSNIQISLINGFLEPNFTVKSEKGQMIKGSGWIDFSDRETEINYSGAIRNIDLKRLYSDGKLPSALLNVDYNMELKGERLSELYGRISFDMQPSVIDGDTLESHQFYADLNAPGRETRKLRITSSLFDMEINGSIEPVKLADMFYHWRPYLVNRFKKEILLDTTATEYKADSEFDLQDKLSLSADIQIKNLKLLNYFWPEVPEITSAIYMESNLNADGERLLVTADIRNGDTQISSLILENPEAQLTANFRYGENWRDFASLDVSANFNKLVYADQNLQDFSARFTLRNDSLSYQQKIEQISGNASLDLVMNARLKPRQLKMDINQFQLGNENYTWHSVTTPNIVYTSRNELHLENFAFRNKTESFELRGTYSSNREDSVFYSFSNVQLGRLSDMITGRISFSGILDASFFTRTLKTRPIVQGDMNINRFMINNRMVGDLSFNSHYVPEREHFKTTVDIRTDSTKYAGYLKQNGGIGQNIHMEGFFKAPKRDDSPEQLYNFDIDFNEIDMWVIREIIPKVFTQLEGRAEGTGSISGDFKTFDYHADFQIHDVYGNANFLNADYWFNGKVELEKGKGVIFRDLQVSDSKNGSGTISGNFDLNNFRPTKYYNITLEMNRLQFLNNNFNRDVPFFGEVYGSGEVYLTGPISNPFLQTTRTVRVTSDSRLAIPLLEETELNQEGKFIRFVNEFDFPYQKKERNRDNQGQQSFGTETDDKSFMELFRLDLQFEAASNARIKLIFDPVTGDVLTARGGGQVNILMDDQDIQMFGRFNINQGQYQFVSGDIFSRKFQLEQGGSIIWEGNPANARLDITAIYTARPSLNSLMGSSAEQRGSGAGDRIQSIPIDLVLRISGTISSIENNFYFRMPNTIEISRNAAIANRINQLNRDQEQKLLQATSLLLTGEFIPVSSSGSEGNARFGENLSGSSMVLNPLLSNQVFSPFLSNQINSLLNSDISSLDIDINLNAYNRVDLGIALRLYNNRLILRREGQVTGPYSDLGNLGATYRINKALSITAFHRQDPTLTAVTNAQTQIEYLNGAGVEAQVDFNSWKELTKRFIRTIKNMFTREKAGRKRKPDMATTEED